MNTFDWVVCGIFVVIGGGYLLLRWIMSGKDSLR
jgi:hypothetical protein